MADAEQLRGRLANIRTVQPVLRALRTISLGSWQAALNRRGGVQRYVTQLQTLIPPTVAAMVERQSLWRSEFFARRTEPVSDAPALEQLTVLAIGTERGLCGRFNQAVLAEVLACLQQQREAGVVVNLIVLGSRLARLLSRNGVKPDRTIALSTSALPSFSDISILTRDWLDRYEAYTLDAVDVIFNAYRGLGRYETTTRRIIPPEITPVSPMPGSLVDSVLHPYIVETDPWSLYARVIEQETMVRCYSLLLESATAEHATRYQLMEGATQNAERLQEELTLELQALRRQAITREMQELAVGAGLLQR